MKKQTRLTIAQLKAFKGLEDLSDDEAEEVIISLEALAQLFYELYQKQNKQQTIQIKLKGNNYEEKRNAA